MDITDLPGQVLKYDFDRAISYRFAPSKKRRGLLLLTAFDHELAKISYQTSDPLLRRIRSQFWTDELLPDGKRSTALSRELYECFSSTPRGLLDLDKLIETHEKYFDNSDSAPMWWKGYEERQSILFKLSYDLIENADKSLDSVFFKHCGAAYSGCKQLWSLQADGEQAGTKRKEIISKALISYNNMVSVLTLVAPGTRAALLPLALVPPYLRLFQTSETKISSPMDLHPVKKVWVIWRSARNGFPRETL